MPYQAVTGLDSLGLDFAKFKQARDGYVARLNSIYMQNLENSGVKYVQGLASFTGPNRVQAEGSADVYEADHICIASGSAPRHSGFEGVDLCMDSNDFFTMDKLPESVCVIGGGYIGVELSQILHSLGSKVSLLVRSVPLQFLDQDMRDMLVNEMKQSGMDVRLQAPHEKVEKLPDGMLKVTL